MEQVAATYVDATTVKLQLSRPMKLATTITDDTYASFPANSRGLEVDAEDNIYFRRNVGNNITIQHPDMADVNISIPNFDPNGLLIALNSDEMNGRALMLQVHRREHPLLPCQGPPCISAQAQISVQIDAFRDKYTWKPSIFRFDNSGVSHK